MPNLIHIAEYLGSGLGLILLGWVLRWGQHRDDCRELERDAYDDGIADGYRRGFVEGRAVAECGQTVMLDGSIPLWERQEITPDPGPAAPTLADIAQVGHTIYPELAALAAEDVPRAGTQADHGRELANSASGIGEAVDSESERDASPGPGHLESTQEWQARMDLEAAQWCARHGLRHESAWAA